MKLGVINNVIKKLEMSGGTDGIYFEWTFGRKNGTILTKIAESSLAQKVLELLERENLTCVENIPIRLFGRLESEQKMTLLGIGHYIKDEWLIIEGSENIYIMGFERLQEVLGVRESQITFYI